MPIELGSFSFGAAAGTAVGVVIGHYLTKSRDTENRRFQQLNTAAEEFRNVLLAAINKIESGKHRSEIIREDFTTHRESMLRFSHCLKGGARRRLETDWNEYQQWYQDVCCRNTAERIYPPEGEEEFKKKCEIDATEFIKKLVSHTSPPNEMA